MIKRLYDWVMSLSRHRFAERWLAFISFIESSFFPIPPDVMLLPMVLADRSKAFRYALICTIASIAGAFLGYAIGYFLWETVAQPIFEFYGYMDKFDAFKAYFIENGAIAVFIFGITFFPFKVITIAAGVTMLDPLVFLLSCIASRTPRFFIEAALLWRFGAPIQEFIEKRLVLITSITIFLVLFGFYALKFIGE